MMNKSSFSLDAPTSWADLLAGTVKVALVAFVVLQLKEFIDAGMFDTPATATDAAFIALAFLVVNFILMRLRL